MAHVAMYALAWDGYVTIDGRRLDAILVESGTADTAEARVVAQPYQTREAGPAAATIPPCRGRRQTRAGRHAALAALARGRPRGLTLRAGHGSPTALTREPAPDPG